MYSYEPVSTVCTCTLLYSVLYCTVACLCYVQVYAFLFPWSHSHKTRNLYEWRSWSSCHTMWRSELCSPLEFHLYSVIPIKGINCLINTIQNSKIKWVYELLVLYEYSNIIIRISIPVFHILSSILFISLLMNTRQNMKFYLAISFSFFHWKHSRESISSAFGETSSISTSRPWANVLWSTRCPFYTYFIVILYVMI